MQELSDWVSPTTLLAINLSDRYAATNFLNTWLPKNEPRPVAGQDSLIVLKTLLLRSAPADSTIDA